MNRKNKRSVGERRGNSPKVTCRALIPLDTEKIRSQYLLYYKQRKRLLDKAGAELHRYQECDLPEFQKFLAARFGAEQTRQREIIEKIHLLRTRFEKISFLARQRGKSKERYCYELTQKVSEEYDFWTMLDRDLADFQEEEEKLKQQFQHDNFEDDMDSDFEDDIFEEEESDYEFERPFPHKRESESDEKEKKTLYRELCLRYHPDKIGAHDAKTQRIWISIQEAYQDGDIVRLRSIHAGIKLETGRIELSCSEISSMIADTECGIRETRAELRNKKRTPNWGFSRWNEAKRKRIERDIRREFNVEIWEAEAHFRALDHELERLRTTYRSKPHRKTREERMREFVIEIPDLFQDF